MTILLLAGLVLLALAGSLVLRAFALSRVRTVATLSMIDAYGFARAQREDTQDGVFPRLAAGIGSLLAPRLGATREAAVRRQLMAAGMYSVTARQLLGYRALATAVLPALVILLAIVAALPSPHAVVLVLAAVASGWYGPLLFVRRRAQRRLERIELALPELIDLLVVTVESGLGFTGSLQLASERVGGPLGQELRLTLQEQRMGLSTSDALENLLERVETPSVRAFVRSMVQGERLGVSIGQILRNLAVEMRKRRRQAAEERAQKAPVKLLFPLVFLIFPAMFVVLLGPAVFAFLEAMR